MVPVGRPAGTPLVDVAPVEPPSTGPLVLGVTPGPRLDWLAHARALVDAAWSVSHDSDRVGVRHGDRVSLEINPLRDGRHSGGFRSATLLDTGQVLGGSLFGAGRS